MAESLMLIEHDRQQVKPSSLHTITLARQLGDEYALLVLGHVWAGLHYEVLTTYVRFEQFHIVNPWIVLSSFIVAYGYFGAFFFGGV